MKIDRKLEKEFIRILQIEDYNRTTKDMDILRKRNEIIMNQFEFNNAVCQKLERLNEMLRNEEKRIYVQYRAIKANAKQMVEKGIIDDFEMDFKISCCTNSYYQKFDPGLGDSFFETKNTFIGLQNGEIYEDVDWSERSLTGDTAVSKFDHCYSFHSLYYFNNDLTWFDIYNIDEIWMDINVNYQFFSKV